MGGRDWEVSAMCFLSTLARRLLVILALVVVALVATGRAAAHNGSPWHSIPDASCPNGYPYLLGNMPSVRSHPESLGTVGGVTGSTPSYDEWIYYRIQVTWTDAAGRNYSKAGNWMAVLNQYTGGEGLWMQQPDGRYVYTRTSDAWGYSGGSNGISRIDITRGRTYHVWGELWWGPFPGYDWLGPHWIDLGSRYCS